MELNNNYKISTTKNGIRVVSEKMHQVRSVALGIWVNVGSRNETEEFNGASHFIEHMIFKGTNQRSAKDIAEETDALGATINAYTSKEYTCFYLKTLDDNFTKTADILADMFLNSAFRKEDVDKEREVIIEEIKMYEDTPDELVTDMFNEMFWKDHSLGKPILGTEESLKNLDENKLKEYKEKYYTASNIVVAAAGHIDHEKVVEWVEKYFLNIKTGEKNEITPFDNYQNKIKCYKKDISQAQICLGIPSVALGDKELDKLVLLNACFGGSMSSRLMQKIREEMGLAYSVYSYYTAYKGSGIMAVNVASRSENAQIVINEILKEAEKIAQNGITQNELNKAFEQLKSNTYMSMESSYNRMGRLGRNLLTLDEIVSPEDRIERISKVTCKDVQELARKLFKKDKLVVTVLGTIDKIEI